MDRENNMFLDKLVLYNLAIICPFLALILAIILGYRKNTDVFLERIKLISVYEIFEILVIGISFIYWGQNGIKISILIFLVFYIFVCGIVAYRKKDYISRGISLGLFANHYSLAIMQTSEESTAKVDNSQWPDSGLAVILMVFKLLFILFLLFPVNSLIIKFNLEKYASTVELSYSNTVEENNSIIEQPLTVNYDKAGRDLMAIMNSNDLLAISEYKDTLKKSGMSSKDFFTILKRDASMSNLTWYLSLDMANDIIKELDIDVKNLKRALEE
jgi:hypothetical protein